MSARWVTKPPTRQRGRPRRNPAHKDSADGPPQWVLAYVERWLLTGEVIADRYAGRRYEDVG